MYVDFLLTPLTGKKKKKKISHYCYKRSKSKPFKWQCAPEDGRTSWVSAEAKKNRMRGRDGAKYSPQ